MQLLIHMAVVAVVLEGIRPEAVKMMDMNDIPVLEDPDQHLNVLVITRYGTTYPLGGTILEGDKYPEIFSKTLRLSDKGHEMMQHVGKLLMTRYQNHISHLAEAQREALDVFKATSTDKDAARDSAHDIATGILKQNLVQKKHFKILVSNENIEKNQWVTFPGQKAKGKCNYLDNMKKKLESSQSYEEDPDVKLAFNTLGVRSVEDVYKKYDRLQIEMLNGIELPDWTRKSESGIDLEVVKKVAIRRVKTFVGDDLTYWKFFVSIILLKVFEEFKIANAVSSTEEREAQKPRIRLHVVDVYVMFTLVWWFRLEGEISRKFSGGLSEYYAQAGDSLILEFDSDQYVRAYYLRPATESGSRVGFKSLSLYSKATVVGAQLGADGGMAAYWLYKEMFQSYDQLDNCCKGKCPPTSIKSLDLRKMKYQTEERGAPNSLEYKIFFKSGNNVISPFHDIPLYYDESKNIFNMVVEIPRWTNAKMEINKKDAMNPIKQDSEEGRLRFVANCFPYHGYIWNYGALPQTWENPNVVDKHTGRKGDDDPVDVLEIGHRVAKVGDVIAVKILGAIALLDGGKTDWKLFAIDVNDPVADNVGDIDDIDKYFPGLMKATLEWFTIYKVPNGKPRNRFAFDGESKDRIYALNIINELHNHWTDLIRNKADSEDISLSSVSVDGPFKINQVVANAVLDKEPPLKPPEPIDASVDEWHFIPLK